MKGGRAFYFLMVERIKNMYFLPVRYMLAYVPSPVFIIEPLYHLGQKQSWLFHGLKIWVIKAINAVAN